MGTISIKKNNVALAVLEELKSRLINLESEVISKDTKTRNRFNIDRNLRFLPHGQMHESFAIKNLITKMCLLVEIDYIRNDSPNLKVTGHLSQYPHVRNFCKFVCQCLGESLAKDVLLHGDITRLDVWVDFDKAIKMLKRMVMRSGVQVLKDYSSKSETYYHGSLRSSVCQKIYELDDDDDDDDENSDESDEGNEGQEKKVGKTRLELSRLRGKMPITRFSQYHTFTSRNYEVFKKSKVFEFDTKALRKIIAKDPAKHKLLKEFLLIRRHQSLMGAILHLKKIKRSFVKDILNRYKPHYHLKPLNKYWNETLARITNNFDLHEFFNEIEKKKYSQLDDKKEIHYEQLQ